MFDAPPPHSLHPTAEEPPRPQQPAPESTRPPPPFQATGEKARARDILAAIRTLQNIEREHRPATTDERDILARFGGFGPVALSLFPDPSTGRFKQGWEELGEELKSLLTPEEYDSARRTVFSQFFTSPVVMRAMHDALRRLGVPEKALVLEPGAGIGNFMAHAPAGMRFIGVELDSLSGRIARALHPGHDIRIENFRDSKLPPLDAVIGNVPFANIPLTHNGHRFSLHDFFIAKSVDSLKPGGVLAVVTSHYTLDKQNAAAREYLAERADFLGAIRLPSDAFKREGTQVVTDVLFLRKRAPGQEPSHADADWLHAAPVSIEGADVPVNRYFIDHPEMVLGTLTRKDTLYGGEGYSVVGSGDLASQLKEAISKLPGLEKSEAERANPPPKPVEFESKPRELQSKPEEQLPRFIPPPPLRHITEGSFFVGEDRGIRQVVDGQAQPVVYGGTTLSETGTMTGKRLARLIDLRDKARRVLQSQNEGWPEQHRQEARRDLNWSYDRFFHDYGPINRTSLGETKDGATIRRMPNLVKFREDPDAMLVMALEEYDEETGRAEKAPILKRDVVGPRPPVDHVTTAEEGLLVSLDHKGAIDLPYIARLYGKPEPEIVAELGDLIYRDPETRSWQPADAYLSGDVRAKLKIAVRAGPEYARNAEALKAVQPEDVLPGDIDANLGAPWIPASDIQDFAAALFNVPAEAIKVGHLKKDAVWSVDPDYRAINSVAATTDYGTPRINGTALLDLALNMRTPVIYDTVRHADREERVINQTETLAAKEKQRAIKERFKAWVFDDPDRAERLVRIYNDAFNNLRPRLFDGSHLEFPGMSEAFQLRPHQEDAVWRCMSGGNTLLAHVVGGGKAQPLDARVLTPTGWARMGNLKVGDRAIAGDGSPTIVTGVFPQGDKEIVRVYFSDGSSTECCDEHLWLTWNYRERTYGKRAERLGKSWACGSPNVRTTAEIRSTLRSPHLGAINHSIPMVGRVEFEARPIALDAYTLGALLGDGSLSRHGVTLTTDDEEMLSYLHPPPNVEVARVVTGKRCPAYKFKRIETKGFGPNRTPHPMRVILEGMGLMGRDSSDKFIPDDYKFNSPEVRLATLQGLLDTDGSVSKRGHSVYYYTASQRLADDVTFLVRSLGGIARLRIKERPTYRHKGELRVGKPCFVLCISLPPDVRPFRVTRKSRRVIPKTSYAPARYIVAIEPVGVKPAQCISVAHPSRLYVTNDFIVTHNTAVMVAAAMKMRQAGLVKKPMVIVPNHMLEQFAREFMQWYPNARLLVATKDDFTRERRKALTAKIATGDWDAIITTHSSFERIGMSREYQERFLREQIAEYESLLVDKASVGRNIIKNLEKQKAAREERLKNLLAEDKKDSGLVFDELGVDQIFYDESQAGKNLEVATKMDRVAGIQTGGSERAFDLYMKARYLGEKHPSHGVVFASGTPISNSMCEMYTQSRYLDPEGLRARGIEHFDGWAATFGEIVEAMEISPDGATLKPRARFAKFINLPELTQMFRSFADVQTAEMLDLPRPRLQGGKPQTIACPMSEEQKELQAQLVKRYERIRNERVDPREDNALAITTDGRKLALDGRMLGAGGDFPGSKINALVANVGRIWLETEPRRGTQMIFCDMGVNPTPWGFSAYDEVIEKLEEIGIPRAQIASIGDADTDAKKQALFERVRQGQVRVLIGSTAKMGTGTNVQRRLVALHHLDAPWKPAEVEQREGRILRQGNQNEEVAIFRYVTEGSFDAYMWQALETKARFINQVMSGESAVRKAEDIGGQELSYAEVKAIASGNPAVLTLAEADAELQRLAILRKNHADEQFMARRKRRELPEEIAELERRIAGLAADKRTVEEHAEAPIVIAGKSCDAKDALALLGKRLEALPDGVPEKRRFPLGVYRGLRLSLALYASGTAEVELEGETKRHSTLLRDSRGPRAVLNAAERIAESYDVRLAEAEKELAVARDQLRDYESRLGARFAHEEYMTRLADLRDRLKLGLSERPPEGGEPVAELAEKIKALRAENAVEGAVERAGVRKVVRAERPVTARIRREVQEVAETGQVEEEASHAAPKAESTQAPLMNSIPQPIKLDYRQSVARRRQAPQEQMRLF